MVKSKLTSCLLLIASNCWTRSFALGYSLLYFSSVFDSDEERKPLQEKDFSIVYVCCLTYPCPYWCQSIFWQSVNILCWTNCWFKHGEAHDISYCLVFAFESVLPYEVHTQRSLVSHYEQLWQSNIMFWLCLLFLARSARFVLLGGMYTFPVLQGLCCLWETWVARVLKVTVIPTDCPVL